MPEQARRRQRSAAFLLAAADSEPQERQHCESPLPLALRTRAITFAAMKQVLSTWVVLVCASFLIASAAGADHSLSIDVRPVSSGGATRTSSELKVDQGRKKSGLKARDQKYSTTRERGSGIGLDVEVRNLRHQPDTATVEWYLFARSLDGGDPFIFDRGSEVVTIGAASREFVNIDSIELTGTIQKNLTLRAGKSGGVQNSGSAASVKKSGSKVAGWIVRLVADQRVLQVRASSPSLEAIGKDASQLRSLAKK